MKNRNRSSGEAASLLAMPRARKRFKPETPFVPISRSMLESPAFRSLSINARRCLDRLLIEHLSHGGAENGRLCVTYDQFVEFGATRENISGALAELERFGFVRIVERGGMFGGEKRPHIFRLTLFPTWDLREPTNDWRKLTLADVNEFRADRRERNAAREGYKRRRAEGKA